MTNLQKAKPSPSLGVIDTMKELLAEDRNRIKLDDYVTGLLKDALAILASDPFWSQPPRPDAESIQARFTYYEATVKSLFDAAVLLARWGRPDQFALLGRILARLAEPNNYDSGFTAWTAGRYYPASFVMYGAGISAIACGNNEALRPILLAHATTQRGDDRPNQLAVVVGEEMSDLGDAFKALPDHVRNYVPRSEYMLKRLREPIEELLFLGVSYEQCFDEYEMLAALVYVDLSGLDRAWADPGRFAWKSARNGQPYNAFVKRAETQGAEWPPVKAGLFASPARFQEVAKAYAATIGRMNFY